MIFHLSKKRSWKGICLTRRERIRNRPGWAKLAASTAVPSLTCLSQACVSGWLLPRAFQRGFCCIGCRRMENSDPSSGIKLDQNTIWSTSRLSPLLFLSCSFYTHQVIFLRSVMTVEPLEESVLCKGGRWCQSPSLKKVSTQPLSLDVLGCRLWQPSSTTEPAWLSTGMNSNTCSPAWVTLAVWKAAFPAAASSFSMCPELWVAKLFV